MFFLATIDVAIGLTAPITSTITICQSVDCYYFYDCQVVLAAAALVVGVAVRWIPMSVDELNYAKSWSKSSAPKLAWGC